MITLLFGYTNEKVMIVIHGNSVKFSSTVFGAIHADISGLKLDYSGSIRQFPDLETNTNWKEEVIKRWKLKIKSHKTEMETVEYITEELKPHGYVLEQIQRKGSRPVKIK